MPVIKTKYLIMHFSKTFVIALSASLLLGACGNSGDKSATTTDTTAGSAAAATTAPASSGSTADDKALELIGSSDCTTCHRLHEAASGASIGPAYDQVAAKYSPAADTTVDRLVKKIISGGSSGQSSQDHKPKSDSHIRVNTRLDSTPPLARTNSAAARRCGSSSSSPASRSATHASTVVDRSAGPP